MARKETTMTIEANASSSSGNTTLTARTTLAALVCAAKRRWRVWRNRREARALLSWDAHALQDIGLTPLDVRLAMAMPYHVDASKRLRVLAVERRAGNRAQAQEIYDARHAMAARTAKPRKDCTAGSPS